MGFRWEQVQLLRPTFFLFLSIPLTHKEQSPVGAHSKTSLKRENYFYILYLKETVQTFCHIYIACHIEEDDAVQHWLTGPGYLKDAGYIPSSFRNAC